MIPLMTDIRHGYQIDFQLRGACRGHDPELFFPLSETTPTTRRQIDEAKAVCQGCPVLESCRSYALAHGPEGIWGGTTESERRALRATKTEADEQVDSEAGNAPGEVDQPEPALPSYNSARHSLARARRLRDLAEQTGDGDALAQAERRVVEAKATFDAVRTHGAAGAVA